MVMRSLPQFLRSHVLKATGMASEATDGDVASTGVAAPDLLPMLWLLLLLLPTCSGWMSICLLVGASGIFSLKSEARRRGRLATKSK
jgi:hypothetical protein